MVAVTVADHRHVELSYSQCVQRREYYALTCIVCGERAERSYEGVESDVYKCVKDHDFSVDWRRGELPQQPLDVFVVPLQLDGATAGVFDDLPHLGIAADQADAAVGIAGENGFEQRA